MPTSSWIRAGILASALLLASTAGWGSVSIGINGSRTVPQSTCTGYTVSLSSGGKPYKPPTDQTITLSGSSSTGKFYKSGTCASVISWVIINSWTSSATYYFKDTKLEALTFIASDGGYVPGSLTVTVTAALVITTVALPPPTMNAVYSAQLSARGGTSALTWSLAGGQLPEGLTLGSASGRITGTPSATATYSFTVQVADAVQKDTQAFTLTTASPSCKDANPVVALPGAPHGMYVIEFPGYDPVPVTQYLVNNPVVCGGNIYIEWSVVDQGPGADPQYDWSSIDSQIAVWTAVGKKVNLIVWPVSANTTINTATPPYVLAQVPTLGCAAKDIIPLFWNPDYVGLYQTFIGQTMARYGSDPDVGYMRIGLASGGETYPTCYYVLKDDYGFTTQVWESYISNMVNFIAGQPHTVQLMGAINGYGTPQDLSVPDWEAGLYAGLDMGFGSQGLKQATIDDYNNGLPCDSDWCAMFQTYVGDVPLESQTLHASSPDGAGEVGTLVDLLPFALQFDTQILEIYLEDFQVAYDPSSPWYEQYSGAYQQLFTDTANVVGMAP